ncbi:MAG: UTP--glucose-1-phosphate uridylyltransferase [Terrimicrobiaceae bacterium]|nr:UTP--glucose-1-phosphate uridylyltransferase [Terrimicrobiaceae bacterium]
MDPRFSSPGLKTFAANLHAGVVSESQAHLAATLIENGQAHLFEGWEVPGSGDEAKRTFFATLETAHASYPGGLPAYIRNARTLLADAAAGRNPFEGCTPEQPDLVDLSGFGPAYDAAEEVGFREFEHTAVVLVAGGLGERLGYHGIKLDIPVEVTESMSYLGHFAAVIRTASARFWRPVPLVIMTSRDTHEGTVATLERNGWFGLAREQVTILRQELVPAVSDLDARLALEKPCELILKPHGHGDIHMLLHTSGTAAKLHAAGVRHLLFIQDTNGQVFNAAFAAIGVSVQQGYDFNSIAVNRVPGEAVGGLARLVRTDGPALTVNVEYNQLDPLLRATVSPDGDVPDARGFSLFPGNINVLVLRLEPYLKVLDRTQGIIAEFINPKFSDASRTTFKKPARLETMMQDLPKLFCDGEKVGVTVFQREWCFSACKNNLTDAADKVAKNGPPESASSAENDFYLAGREKLRSAGADVIDGPVRSIRGIPFTMGPRVVLRPGFALTRADVRARVRNVRLADTATLVLDGDVTLENVSLGGNSGLVVSAVPGAKVTVRDLALAGESGFELLELTDSEMTASDVPEFLRIRGYRIENRGAREIRVTEPGEWLVTDAGDPVRV